MIRTVLTMLAGEARLQVRQPMALFVLLGMPLLMVPGALFGMELYMGSLDRAAGGGAGLGGVVAHDPVVIASDEVFAGWIEPQDQLRVVAGASVPRTGELGPEDALLQVSVDDRDVAATYRVDLSRSRSALDVVRTVVVRQGVAERDLALKASGLDITAEALVAVTVEDHSAADRRGGDRVGAVLPPLLLFALVVAAVYTALDVVTGEKERRTVETLLVTQVDRRAVLIAKGLITAGSAAIAGWIGLGTLAALRITGVLDLPHVLGDEGVRALTGGPLLGLALAIGLLALQAAGASLVLAAWAPDYRTGSMLSGPAMVALLGPSAVSAMPSVALSPGIALVPVANVSLACRDLLTGELDPIMGLVTVASTAVYGGLSLAAAWSLLGREESLVGGGDRRGRRALGYHGRDAVAVFVSAVLLLWFFGQLAQSLDLVWGMVFTQLVLFGGLAIGAVAYLGLPWKRTLSLGLPHPVDWPLAIVAGLTLPVLGALAATLQDPVIPTPSIFQEALGEALLLDSLPLWVPLLVFALLPGVCEELLFRGALLGLLRRSLSPVPRVLVVGLAFGLIHLALPRLLPTAVLGIVFGFVVVRTRSLWPAVLMHALNNGVLLVAGRLAGADNVEPPALWLLLAMSVVPLAALAAMGRFSRQRGLTSKL